MKLIHLVQDNARGLLDEDHLGVKPWVDVVAGSALANDGPFTIGIYKEWGYGKTTLLQLSKASVEKFSKNPKNPVVTVWFNAWQYEREEHPLFPLIAAITDAIEERVSNENAESPSKLKKIGLSLRALTRGMKLKGEAGVPLLGKVGVEFDAKEALLAEELLGRQTNPLQGELLYHAAFQLLGEAAQGEGKAKIVVFIDDLDRCNPKEAVRLLECIKLVLAQKGFVFVLAVDNQVIEQFLDKVYEDEYGFEKGSGRGRHYMEKIVQLPLVIPSHEKRFQDYVERLVEELAKKYPKDDIKIGALRKVQSVLAAHVGHNPRRLVRLIDAFLIDTFLWDGTKGLRTEFKELDETVANAIVIHRVVHSALGDLLTDALVRDKDLRQRIAMGALDGQESDGDGLTEARTADNEAGRRLRSMPHVLALLQTEQAKALVNPGAPDLWEAVLHFMTIARTEQAVTFPDEVAEKIRAELGLDGESPIPANRLSEVTELRFLNTRVTTGGLKSLVRLVHLTRLHLTGPRVTNASLRSLERLSGLIELGLDGAQVTDAGIKSLERLIDLTKLHISYTQVTDAGLQILERQSGLTELGLNGTQVTDAGIKSLERLIDLTKLYISDTQVTDAGLGSLALLTRLTELGLSGTQVTDAGIARLEPLTGLNKLYISNTQLTDAGLKSLKRMAHLTTLFLSDTKVTDAGLKYLLGLTSLTHLRLDGTHITHTGLKALRAKLPNCQITL